MHPRALSSPRHETSKSATPGLSNTLRGAALGWTALAFLAISARAEVPFTATCLRVFDGDTIEVLHGGQEIRVRLEGIDAPEAGQPFATRSRQYLSNLVLERRVMIDPRGRDPWDRVIARVRVGQIDTSEALVAMGLAWHFVRYSDDPELARLERQARALGRGLWAGGDAVAPWDYRERQRLLAEERDRPGGTRLLSGNVGSGVFHRSICEHFRCRNCTRLFATRDDALKAGFRPCGRCRP